MVLPELLLRYSDVELAVEPEISGDGLDRISDCIEDCDDETSEKELVVKRETSLDEVEELSPEDKLVVVGIATYTDMLDETALDTTLEKASMDNELVAAASRNSLDEALETGMDETVDIDNFPEDKLLEDDLVEVVLVVDVLVEEELVEEDFVDEDFVDEVFVEDDLVDETFVEDDVLKGDSIEEVVVLEEDSL